MEVTLTVLYLQRRTVALGQTLHPTSLGSQTSPGLLPWVLLPGELSVPVYPSDASFVMRLGNCQCRSPFLNTEDVEIGDEQHFSLCDVY